MQWGRGGGDWKALSITVIVTQSGRVKQADQKMTGCTRTDGDEGKAQNNGKVPLVFNSPVMASFHIHHLSS